jgi:hypothetical protein
MQEAVNIYYHNDEKFSVDFDEYYKSLIPFGRINGTLLPQNDVLNRYTLIASSVFEIKWLIAGLLTPQKYHSMLFGGRFTIDAKTYEKEGVELMVSLNFENLSSLEVLDIIIAEPELQFGLSHSEFTGKLKAIFGFDELFTYCVFLRLKEKYYKTSITIVQYNNHWFIYGLLTSLVDTGTAVIQEIAESEYITEVSTNSKTR